MKVVSVISVLLVLTIGFIIGSIIGVEVVQVSGVTIPSDTMYSFIVTNIGMLGSFSSFLALVFAVVLYSGWKNQQKHILLLQHKKVMLENLAKLASTFRFHIMYGSLNQSESEIFYKKIFGQILLVSENINVYYMLKGVERGQSSYADVSLKLQGDFLDPVKEYYFFITNYYSLTKNACIHFDDKKIGYLDLSNDLAKKIFEGSTTDNNFHYINIAIFSKKVSNAFDIAADSIREQLG